MVTKVKSVSNLSQYTSEEYSKAEPYPHIVIDNFLDEELANQVLEEFQTSRDGVIYYKHYNEDKLGINRWDALGETVREVINDLNSEPFLEWLGQLTGVDDLIADKDLDGAGLHEMKRDGFLNIHTDFLTHAKNKTWERKCNLFLFLNKNWQDEYNGHLEMWDKDAKNLIRKIAPVFNRCVIFNTTEVSFHGVPRKLECPEEVSRKSLALYYFKDHKINQPLKPTHYKALPEASNMEKSKVAMDRSLVWAYSFAKRYLGVSDTNSSKLLKIISKETERKINLDQD